MFIFCNLHRDSSPDFPFAILDEEMLERALLLRKEFAY